MLIPLSHTHTHANKFLFFIKVLYNVEGFLDKNRDFLPNNLIYTARSEFLYAWNMTR